MAESVDALVSNTSGAIRAGSTPAQGTDSGILRGGFPSFDYYLFLDRNESHLYNQLLQINKT